MDEDDKRLAVVVLGHAFNEDVQVAEALIINAFQDNYGIVDYLRLVADHFEDTSFGTIGHVDGREIIVEKGQTHRDRTITTHRQGDRRSGAILVLTLNDNSHG